MKYSKITGLWHNLTHCLSTELGIAIVGGELSKANSVLTMNGISEKYQVSMNVVRESLKILFAKGLVTISPRSGITPTDPEYWNLFDSDVLTWALTSNSACGFLYELEQLRVALEPSAARLAAANFANGCDISPISTALRKVQSSTLGTQELLDAENEFHFAVLTASQNPYFISMHKCIYASNNLRFLLSIPNEYNLKIERGSYQEIFNAITTGDQSMAFTVAKEIAERFSCSVRELLSHNDSRNLKMILKSESYKAVAI